MFVDDKNTYITFPFCYHNLYKNKHVGSIGRFSVGNSSIRHLVYDRFYFIHSCAAIVEAGHDSFWMRSFFFLSNYYHRLRCAYGSKRNSAAIRQISFCVALVKIDGTLFAVHMWKLRLLTVRIGDLSAMRRILGSEDVFRDFWNGQMVGVGEMRRRL